MSITVSLEHNRFLNDGSLHPRVVQQRRIKPDVLLGYMAKDTAIEKNDMRTVMEQLVDALVFCLSNGLKAQTAIGTFSLGMRLSESGTDQVDASGMYIRYSPDGDFLDRLRKETEIIVERKPPARVPIVDRIINTEGEPGIDAGRPGQVIALRGAYLSFGPADEETGVFFIGTNGATGAEHRAVNYSRTGSACVDCKVPELPDGLYEVQVRTRPTDKEIRTGAYKGVYVIGQVTAPAGG